MKKQDLGTIGSVKDGKEYLSPELKVILLKNILKVSEEQGGGGPVRPIEDGGKITFQ